MLAATFTVDSTADESDAAPGDGTCATADGDCTLRAAVEESNQLAGTHVIMLPAGTYDLVHGVLVFSCDDVTCDTIAVVGTAPAASTIEGDDSDDLIQVSGRAVSLFDLTLRHGRIAVDAEQSSTVAVHDSHFSDNGYGVYGHDSSITVTGSVLARNGSGIVVDFVSATVEQTVIRESSSNGIQCFGAMLVRATLVTANAVGISCDTIDVGAPIVGLTIDQSVVSDNTFEGLYVLDSLTHVSDTRVSGNGRCGIETVSDNNISLLRTSVEQNGCGVRLGTAMNRYSAHIADSVVRDNDDRGVIANGTAGFMAPPSLTIERSTIAANRAGGIVANNVNGNGPALRIVASTIADNHTTDDGGGIAVVDETGSPITIAVVNSTLSGNSADGSGGAIFNGVDALAMTLANVTVAGNVAEADDDGVGMGGGIANATAGSITLVDTIVAGNSAGGQPSACAGTVTSGGYDVFDTSAGCTIAGDATGNLLGVDAKLGPLADNGGPTLTHALRAGSPAFDAGNPAGCRDDQGALVQTDQRAVARPQGPRCDVGALESTCGNGALDAGEECDDRNGRDGDCCSGDCRLETNDSPCTGSDTCATGTCSGGLCINQRPGCGACETCAPGGTCVPNVMTGCHEPTARLSSRLHLVAKKTSQLAWQWTTGDATAIAEFGDPLGGDRYALCLFDESGAAPRIAFRGSTRAGQCGRRPCWKRVNARTFEYRDPQATPDGLAHLFLKSGEAGKSKVLVSGRGAALDLPALPLALPSRMQLQAPSGACWEARYDPAGASRNRVKEFTGKALGH